MYTLLKKTIFISVVILSFSGCLKKGEDDPFVSLRTRKARIVGSWAMISGSSITTVSSDAYMTPPNIGTTTITYTKDSYTSNFQKYSNSPIVISTGICLYQLQIKKDGTFSSSAALGNNSSILIGTWNFTGGIGKKKNKSQIVLSPTTTTGLISNPYSLFFWHKTDITLDIKELRNKKMVLASEKTETSFFETVSISENYIFEQL